MTTLELIKSSKVFEEFNSQIKNNKLSHAYLIQAEDEFSSELFADYFAKMILCENKNACGQCSACKKSYAGTHADLIKIGNEKQILVDDISKIIDDVLVKPIEGENKVYVLCNFDNASEICQNKLLKTLEEPPKGVHLFLCVKNTSSVLQTIISRTNKLVVDSFTESEIFDVIKALSENKEDVQLISALSNNSIGQAIKNCENKYFISTVNLAYEIIEKCKKSGDILEFSSKITQNKQEIPNLFKILQFVFQEIISYKTSTETKAVGNRYEDIIQNASLEFSLQAIFNINKEIFKAEEKMQFNCNINSVIDVFLLKFLEEKYKWR